jgi:DNA-binding CsgD family transcriptional regulator
MGQSGRVRFADLCKAYRLIHECRDLGHEAMAWLRHALCSLPALVGAQVVMGGQIRFSKPGVVSGVNVSDHGWPTPRVRAHWYERYVLKLEWARLPTFQRFVALSGPLLTRTREQLVDDREWYSSAEFQEFHREWGVDDLLATCRLWNNPPGAFAFTMVRRLREKKFVERERRLVHLFHHELSRYVGTALALEHGGAIEALPLRLRQTLKCLLEGDSERQVAVRLGLSRHTVHEYVTALYRRLDVSSRPEVMARCLRGSRPVEKK